MTKIRHGGISLGVLDSRYYLRTGFITENYLGISCSGANMTANRTLTLVNTSLTTNERVFLNGLRLRPTDQYSIVNNATGSIITFLPIIRNDSRIVVDYFT